MPELATITTALTLLGKLNDIVTGIKDKKQQHVFFTHLIEMQKTILSLQSQLGSLQDANHKLRQQLNERHDTAQLKTQFFHANGAYWRRGETTNDAYCPACFNKDGVISQLQQNPVNRAFKFCPICKVLTSVSYNAKRPTDPE